MQTKTNVNIFYPGVQELTVNSFFLCHFFSISNFSKPTPTMTQLDVIHSDTTNDDICMNLLIVHELVSSNY